MDLWENIDNLLIEFSFFGKIEQETYDKRMGEKNIKSSMVIWQTSHITILLTEFRTIPDNYFNNISL